MAKKEKKQKVKPEKIKDEEVKVNNDPNKDEDNEKISIKKNFRDTFIVLGALVAVVAIVFFINKDAFLKGMNPELEEEEQNQLTKEEKVVQNLALLANRELLMVKPSLDTDKNYINYISSLEYEDSNVTFVAISDQEGSHYAINVRMNYEFHSIDRFISEMSTLNLSGLQKYDINPIVMNLVNDEYIDVEFVNNAAGLLTTFDDTKPHTHVLFKGTNVDETYISTTFVGSDNLVYSVNEITYDSTTSSFGSSFSRFSISEEENESLYKILTSFIQ